MIGTTSSGISYHLRDIYSICRCCWNVATYKWKVTSGKIENDPEQLAHTSENSPALSLSKTDSGPVESQSSQTGATKSDLESSVSTTDTQQNIEPPYHGIAILTVMDDLVKRKLLSSKWNDSHILKFPSRYIN
jgi:hypothetical protein